MELIDCILIGGIILLILFATVMETCSLTCGSNIESYTEECLNCMVDASHAGSLASCNAECDKCPNCDQCKAGCEGKYGDKGCTDDCVSIETDADMCKACCKACPNTDKAGIKTCNVKCDSAFNGNPDQAPMSELGHSGRSYDS